MDNLSNNIDYTDHIYIPYSIEKTNNLEYIVFYLEKIDKELCFLRKKKLPNIHVFKGVINWNNISYLFYEIVRIESEFLKAEEEDLWKVTPYELLYTRSVINISIHLECIHFFKNFPDLFLMEEEVPIVAYIGIGESELNEQILLQNKNEKKGMLGKGYYFTTYENAEKDSLYTDEKKDNLIRLENKLKLNNKDFQDTTVYIKDHKFYHYNNYLGDVPLCNESLHYFIYYYDKEVVYLKSLKPHHCKKEIKLRKENGFVLRYVIFLNNTFIGKGKGYDSYSYDSQYMIRNPDNFICLSYHSIKKNK